MLDVKNLSVKYSKAKKLALDSITISAEPGEFVVIAGPSGSGKSTLAKVILGLIPAFEQAQVTGRLYYDNKNLDDYTRKDRIELLGYVPQYPSDFTTTLLVEEEIVFMLENLGLNPEKIKKILEEIIDLLGLE
ncbi:MAG: ATP-binding cassette domain-containing protein, partial [Candidatus Heimdallarchaeaceae archaeon]